MSRFFTMRNIWRPVVAVAGALLCSSFAPALLAADATQRGLEIGTPDRIEVYPTHVKLETPRRHMHLVVSGHYANGHVQDLTRVAEITSANPAVVKVEEQVLTPTGN